MKKFNEEHYVFELCDEVQTQIEYNEKHNKKANYNNLHTLYNLKEDNVILRNILMNLYDYLKHNDYDKA